ncbi:thioredoxin TrxC [Novosphingobium sp. KCTC 2891]|uniref:thioredoxin TrxC n=1 Tax=Novosphingobium sp. KCTC 2891 TaxID=2989730 RepID=UPI0022214F61|nr:thioredoxin TrxC [Novosphingobium sp. KCTC 2891]MCW1381367.1 thioredoxin TrxC [Novosphingobium sp. KCTC 2891]
MSDEIVVCPACGGLNRVPASRLAQGPSCGKCHRPLFSGAPADVDEAMFERMVQKGTLPVLADFWAAWCGPCRTMAPAFAAAAAKLEPHVRLVKVDTEKAQALSGQLAIRSIPTLALFRQGREVARQAGALPESQIVGWARAALQ